MIQEVNARQYRKSKTAYKNYLNKIAQKVIKNTKNLK